MVKWLENMLLFYPAKRINRTIFVIDLNIDSFFFKYIAYLKQKCYVLYFLSKSFFRFVYRGYKPLKQMRLQYVAA